MADCPLLFFSVLVFFSSSSSSWCLPSLHIHRHHSNKVSPCFVFFSNLLPLITPRTFLLLSSFPRPLSSSSARPSVLHTHSRRVFFGYLRRCLSSSATGRAPSVCTHTLSLWLPPDAYPRFCLAFFSLSRPTEERFKHAFLPVRLPSSLWMTALMVLLVVCRLSSSSSRSFRVYGSCEDCRGGRRLCSAMEEEEFLPHPLSLCVFIS